MRVPVLSKTIKLTRPAMFILSGEIQNMFCFLSLETANTIPTVIAAGKAGGTVIVTKSKDLSII